jgi:voltage-gated potassium channel
MGSSSAVAAPTPITSRHYRQLENGRIEHRAEPLILLLALLVVPALLLEQSANGGLREIALWLNLVIWGGFAAELAFVLAVSHTRLRTLRAHWLDAAIVLVSFPVMPALLQSARALRLLRLLRFVRLAVAGTRAMHQVSIVFRPSGFRYVAALVGVLVIVAGTALSLVERSAAPSVADGLWWALATATTVGYGDIAPESPQGRAIAAVVMLLGIGFFAMITATVAAIFVRNDDSDDRELLRALAEVSERLDRIERTLEAEREQ